MVGEVPAECDGRVLVGSVPWQKIGQRHGRLPIRGVAGVGIADPVFEHPAGSDDVRTRIAAAP
jgi:hypothetical protein